MKHDTAIVAMNWTSRDEVKLFLGGATTKKVGKCSNQSHPIQIFGFMTLDTRMSIVELW